MILERFFPNVSPRQKDALRIVEASLLVVVTLTVFWFLPQQARKRASVLGSYAGPPMHTIAEAYQLAFPLARKWEREPHLITMDSTGGIVDQYTGASSFFRVWFGSSQKESAAYEVLVEKKAAQASGEFVSDRRGSKSIPKFDTLPGVLEQLRAVPGYGGEEVLSFGLDYQEGSGTWLWVLRTKNHGVVTYEAETK